MMKDVFNSLDDAMETTGRALFLREAGDGQGCSSTAFQHREDLTGKGDGFDVED